MKFLKREPKLSCEASPSLPRDFLMVSHGRFSAVVNYFHKNADKEAPVQVREKPFSVFVIGA
jgi:hypothetical protein